jgi:hypothetical protein
MRWPISASEGPKVRSPKSALCGHSVVINSLARRRPAAYRRFMAPNSGMRAMMAAAAGPDAGDRPRRRDVARQALLASDSRLDGLFDVVDLLAEAAQGESGGLGARRGDAIVESDALVDEIAPREDEGARVERVGLGRGPEEAD